MKKNYNDEMMKLAASFTEKKKLLLHCCCAPCATACIERLLPFFEITAYFYNPNLENAEFEKRLTELKNFLSAFAPQAGLLVPPHEPELFYGKVTPGGELEPEGGKRCESCFRLRLSQTARWGKENGFDFFATTLTVSPLKNADRLNSVGFALQEELAFPYLPSDFKKAGGYLRTVELSAQYGLYRQNFCGCEFSRR